MKKILAVFVLVITGLTVNSCLKDKGEEQFVFPLQTGNSWDYIHTQKYTKANSDSASVLMPNADSTTVHMFIAGTKSFGDSALTYELRSLEQTEFAYHKGLTYYRQLKTGLYSFAYKVGAGGGILPKKNRPRTVRFQGKNYSSVHALSDAIFNQRVYAKTSSDSVIIQNPAPLVYKYPFKTGGHWTFIENEDFMIAKIVSRKEVLELESGIFSCYKIDWLYDWDDNGEWDDDISLSDYVSKEGLVRRVLILRGMKFTDQQGQEIETVDFFNDYTLSKFDI